MYKQLKTHHMSLVPKEVDLLESFVLYKLQTVTLVPPIRENIKGDLTPDGKRQVEVEVLWATLLAKLLDECSADLVFLIKQISLVVVVHIG